MKRKILFGSLAAAALLGSAHITRADYYFSGPFGPGGTHNLYRAVTLPATWDRARANSAVSEYNGTPGHLVAISSAAENTFINANAGGDWWIGLTDSDAISTIDNMQMPGFESGANPANNREVGWAWVNGEPYSNLGLWGDGEPNDWPNHNPPGEDAVHKRGDALWNDHTAGGTLGQVNTLLSYIIEYPLNSADPIAVPPLPVPNSQWKIQTYQEGITSLAKADALIGGANLAPGFPVTENLFASDTNDTFTNAPPGSGNFTFDAQVPGLSPSVDNNDFTVVGTGSVSAVNAGNYRFRTTTDDGSRLRVSINGAPLQQIITDDVLSGPHNVDSVDLALNANDVVTFEWTWFERAGGATGELAYSSDGGTTFLLIGDDTAGLQSLDGVTATTYAANPSVIGGTLDLGNPEADAIVSPGNLVGEGIRPTFNVNNTGAAGIFGGDDQPPGMTGSDQDHFMARGTGFLQVTEAGVYNFASLSDDGSRLTIDGTVVILDDTYHGAGYPGDQKTGSIFLDVGFHPIEYQFFDAAGGGGGELYLLNEDGTPRALVGDDLNGGLLVTQQVPEPSTLALSGLGLIGLALTWARKRFKK
jgi:hypothetical protein